MIDLHMSKMAMRILEKKQVSDFAQSAVAHIFPGVSADLSITIRDDAFIRQYNQAFLGSDSATDVLSFPAHEPDPETGQLFLGDIVLSIDTIERQAAKADHSPFIEAQLLILHALLHIKGLDHDTQATKDAMWAEQDKLLTHFAVAVKALPENNDH
jgi:probable rRNA maturation factor